MLKSAEKKVISGMKIQLFNIILKSTNSLKYRTKIRKIRYNVIYNVEPFIKYGRHPRGERLVDKTDSYTKISFHKFSLLSF